MLGRPGGIRTHNKTVMSAKPIYDLQQNPMFARRLREAGSLLVHEYLCAAQNPPLSLVAIGRGV